MSYCSGCMCPTFTHILIKDDNYFGTLKEVFGFFGFLGTAMISFGLMCHFFLNGSINKISSAFLCGVFFISSIWIVYGIMIFSIQLILSQLIIILCLLSTGIYKIFFF